jgi:hypothetical protein
VQLNSIVGLTCFSVVQAALTAAKEEKEADLRRWRAIHWKASAGTAKKESALRIAEADAERDRLAKELTAFDDAE